MAERLRVVHVLEATVGGVRKHVLDLCTRLDPWRFELHAIVSPLRDPDPAGTRRQLEAARVRVVEVPMRRGPSPPHDLRALGQITRMLHLVQPHLVHTHSTKAGLLGRLAARRAAVPGIVHTPHAFPFTMAVSLPARRAYLAVERYLAGFTDAIIAVCPSERQVALSCGVAGPEQCVVVENGVDLAPPPAVDRERKLADLGLPADARLILCVGDLRPQKGHWFAVTAMKTVLQAEPRAFLLIAGEGPMRRRLERMATPLEGHVLLPGLRWDVPELLACCDVVCQPSLWEGCPYALLEAAAARCALVGHDIPGNTDVIRDGETGRLVRTWDVEGLARALLEALAGGDEWAERGAAARRLVEERFSVERMVDLTADLYGKVAAGRGSVLRG